MEYEARLCYEIRQRQAAAPAATRLHRDTGDGSFVDIARSFSAKGIGGVGRRGEEQPHHPGDSKKMLVATLVSKTWG